MLREFMNSKETKIFLKAIKEQYGEVPSTTGFAFLKAKDKVYLVSREVDRINLSLIRVNSMGKYIAEFKNTQVRLSIEGSQWIGPIATKNVHEVTLTQLKSWIEGKDLQFEGDYSGFVIIKHQTDFAGSGKFKEGVVFNYIPKSRRVGQAH